MKYCIFFLILFTILVPISGQNLENIKDKKAVELSGSLSLQSNFYGVSGIEQRRSPFSYSVTGSPILKIYGITLPFTIFYSNEQSRFSQPFNQFGVSPYYKWAKFHLGYRNVHFSPYTLAGHTFLGVGVELNPGKLRFGAVYGRFQKAIAEDTALVVDSTLYNKPIPSFERKGYAIKIGMGSEKNYVDFIYFKGSDDFNSIPYQPELYDISPAENAVFGISSNFTFFKSLTWKTDIGLSLYTLDTMAQGFEGADIEKHSILNSVITPNVSTQILTAGETSLKFKQKYYALNLKYKRVDPDYKSMGIYYIQGNLEQYTFGSSVMLFKNKWITSGTIGFQHDNLYDKNAMNTGRTIGSCNMSINPNQKFGLNLQYSNYGISQRPSGLIQDLSDTLTIHQISQSVSIMPRLSIINAKASHIFFVQVSYQGLRNKNLLNNMTSDMTSKMVTFNYNVMLMESNMSVSPSVFYNSTEIVSGLLKNIGISARLAKPFLENRVQDGLSISYNKNFFNSVSNGFTLTINGNIQAAISKNLKHNLICNLSWMFNKVEQEIDTELAETRSFSETLISFGYNYSF